MNQSVSHANAKDFGSSLSAVVDIFKNGFALIKDFLVIIVVVVVLIFLFGHRDTIEMLFSHATEQLKNAKVDKFTVAGIEVTFDDTAQKVQSATQTIDRTRKSLQDLLPEVKGTNLKYKLENLLAQLGTAATTTQSAEAALKTGSQQAQKSLTMASPAAPISGSVGEWVVVVSADKSLEPAQYEVEQLQKLGYGAKIYERRGWLRTVVPFQSEDDATAGLANIQQHRRSIAQLT